MSDVYIPSPMPSSNKISESSSVSAEIVSMCIGDLRSDVSLDLSADIINIIWVFVCSEVNLKGY